MNKSENSSDLTLEEFGNSVFIHIRITIDGDTFWNVISRDTAHTLFTKYTHVYIYVIKQIFRYFWLDASGNLVFLYTYPARYSCIYTILSLFNT